MPNLSTYLIIITKKCHLEYGRQKKTKTKNKAKKKPSNKQINKQETKTSHHVCWDCTKWELQMKE